MNRTYKAAKKQKKMNKMRKSQVPRANDGKTSVNKNTRGGKDDGKTHCKVLL